MDPEATEVKQAEAPTPSQPTADAWPVATPALPFGQVLKKRKKRRYSKGLKDLQQLERTVSKTSSRVARAVAKGMTTYRKRSNKSALKKRDGAMRDFAVNVADGISKTMRVLSGIPSDLVKGLNTKQARKRVRRQLRVTSRVLRPFQ